MTKTPSAMIPLGFQALQFSLTDVVSGKTIGLRGGTPNTAKATVIMFICNHCPYVKHISKEMVSLATNYSNLGVQFIAINSNDVDSYPEDSPEHMKQIALLEKYPFPYLFDETQEVAKAYHAACTPDFFIFDASLKLVYRGQFDDSRPGNNIPVSGNSIQYALNCTLAGKQIIGEQKPSLGCNIKWKE